MAMSEWRKNSAHDFKEKNQEKYLNTYLAKS